VAISGVVCQTATEEKVSARLTVEQRHVQIGPIQSDQENVQLFDQVDVREKHTTATVSLELESIKGVTEAKKKKRSQFSFVLKFQCGQISIRQAHLTHW
jgi:uncharacterized protein YpuA (DUF1002 family)